MKIIISHDIDHLTAMEHKFDFIIPKFIVRNSIECMLGEISARALCLRLFSIFRNKWQNIEEIMEFDKSEAIPSTFFISVERGRNLYYEDKIARIWMQKILEKGFELGVHGIVFNKFDAIKYSFDKFRIMAGLKTYGIRIHYLNHNENTLTYLEKAGYLFDSSMVEEKNPYKIGNLWEFPLHIMDQNLIYGMGKFQRDNLFDIKERTKYRLDELFRKRIKFASILFHDRYFDDSFSCWKDWYIWLVQYLKRNNFVFINYVNSIAEMKNGG